MKKYCLLIICCGISMLSFSQVSKQKIAPKTAVSKKPQPVKEKIAEKKVLTPAEVRRVNTDDLLSLMFTSGQMFSTPYDIYSDRKKYTEYKDVTDTSATILLKNILGHTTDRILVTYDSTKVKHMLQYANKNKTRNVPDFNTTWTWVTELKYSYFFVYDSIHPSRIITIGQANAGLEKVYHQITRYFLTYTNDAVDSVECKDHDNWTFHCIYYNGKKRPDSVYNYSYYMSKPPVKSTEYIDRFRYERTGSIQKDNLYQPKMPYQGLKSYRMDFSGKGVIDRKMEVSRDLNYGTQEVLMNVYGYDSTGHLISDKEYKSPLYITNLAAADSVALTTTPHQSSYVYNDQGQVIKKIVSYHDNCEDSEETIEYAIDQYGFLTQVKSTKVSKFKCRL